MTLDKQEGGNHYRNFPIQPIKYIVANGIGFLAGNVVKYVTRYRAKNGAEDILKAIHYLELILEFEYAAKPKPKPHTVVLTHESAAAGPQHYQASPTGPALILKLESGDEDTQHVKDRSDQEGCDAQGPGQEPQYAYHPDRHTKGSG
jgi:hypothetical protein